MGAVIGAIAGGGKGAAIGTLAGGAAGTGAAAATGQKAGHRRIGSCADFCYLFSFDASGSTAGPPTSNEASTPPRTCRLRFRFRLTSDSASGAG